MERILMSIKAGNTNPLDRDQCGKPHEGSLWKIFGEFGISESS